MFAVDAAAAAAIQRAFEEGGEGAAVVELRRHFQLVTSNEHATSCVRAILGWQAPLAAAGHDRSDP